MNLLDQYRKGEHWKYREAYAKDGYRMHGPRMDNARQDLADIPLRTSYLDVGCGRGEMLDYATELGFKRVRGTEIVPDLIDGFKVHYGEVHALPFEGKKFDVVSAFDVIEHLVPGDDEALCKEMQRIARKYVLITANNTPSCSHIGEELHINKRPYAEWDALFKQWFNGTVVWIPTTGNHQTERWKVYL